jgi:hypothetical protein
MLAGLRGSMDQVAIRDAILRFDPAARIWTNWPANMIAVETAAPAEALRTAVQDAGYIAAQRQGPPPTRAPVGFAAGAMMLIGLTVAGLVLGSLLGVALGMGHFVLNPRCGTPGDSGGCAMGIPMIAIGVGLLGAPLGFAIALWRLIRQ